MAKLYNFTNYPTTIQKKITLLNHFNTFLTSKLTDRPFSPSTNQIPPPYLKK